MKRRNLILNGSLVLFILIFLFSADNFFDDYPLRLINLCAIYIILGLSMNLVNGFTGLFSLGQAGFMAVGAYTTALLTMSKATKEATFFMAPLIWPLNSIEIPFYFALIIGGILAAFVAFLIGAPVLRLKGDYLGIATLGFAEIIRIVIVNTQTVTNGALGLKGIPNDANIWWNFGIAALTVAAIVSLINSSFGRALKAIREDEIAAESMGINLFKHKTLSFILGAFFAGIGGGLLAILQGTIAPDMFNFILTFNILLIIVLGGMGSVSGTIISAVAITLGTEYLAVIDKPIDFGFFETPGIPGMRMVVISAILMAVVLFYRHGLMGTKELNWDMLIQKFSRRPLKKGGIES
ncbi:MAG: branched-chain amino acid ABC transporter permease [Clostridia bacterium]|nr:branched-chain amino acid ABC transporter permease [Clostridia bacterium]